VIQAIAFYLFATIVIASAALTILARNPVHSVLWLILAFFNAAGLFLLLGAEFLAAVLVIVYVGAVAVLFLFVVMMLDIDFAALRAGFARYLPLGTLLVLVLLAELIFAIGSWQAGSITPGVHGARVVADASLTNTEALGAVLYTRFAFVFEAAGIILLVAMIGAIVLTHRTRSDVRRQSVSDQVARRPEDAVRITRPKSGEGVSL